MLRLFCKTISEVKFQVTGLWISLKIGECFDLFYFMHLSKVHHFSLQNEQGYEISKLKR